MANRLFCIIGIAEARPLPYLQPLQTKVNEFNSHTAKHQQVVRQDQGA